MSWHVNQISLRRWCGRLGLEPTKRGLYAIRSEKTPNAEKSREALPSSSSTYSSTTIHLHWCLSLSPSFLPPIFHCCCSLATAPAANKMLQHRLQPSLQLGPRRPAACRVQLSHTKQQQRCQIKTLVRALVAPQHSMQALLFEFAAEQHDILVALLLSHLLPPPPCPTLFVLPVQPSLSSP